MPNYMKRAGMKYGKGGSKKYQEGGIMSAMEQTPPEMGPGMGSAMTPPGVTANPGMGAVVNDPNEVAPPVVPAGMGAGVPTGVPPTPPPANVLGAATEAAKALGAKGRGGILSRGGQTKGNGIL